MSCGVEKNLLISAKYGEPIIEVPDEAPTAEGNSINGKIPSRNANSAVEVIAARIANPTYMRLPL
jgi:hypothetical protein